MKITLIRDLRDKTYYVQVDDPDSSLAAVPAKIRIVAGEPIKLDWTTEADFVTVSNWLIGVGLRPTNYKSIWPGGRAD